MEPLVSISPRYVLLTVVVLLDPLFLRMPFLLAYFKSSHIISPSAESLCYIFFPMQLKGSLVFEVPEFLEHKSGILCLRVEGVHLCES